jgi:molecular chaperone GrpE
MRSSPGNERASEPDAPTADVEQPSLEELRAQLASAEDRYLRARADLDNYRKRAEREVERRVREQGDEQLRSWLEVVDSIERALALEAQPRLADGLRVFLEQMETILARQGVRRTGEVGERFDPELHEAVAVITSTNWPAGTIADVARSGYSVGDRVIRPAHVAVARPPDDSG